MGITCGGSTWDMDTPWGYPEAFHLGLPWGFPCQIPMEFSSLVQVWFGAISNFHSPTNKSAARNSVLPRLRTGWQ